MSAKDCDNHGHHRRKLFRRIFGGILIFNFIILVIVLLIWAILRPTKPHFILQDATVYAFNATTSPSLLTSNIQLTISSRNPNYQIGVYYDKLDVYAIYRNQQVTLRTTLPSTYQGHNEVDVWSPFVYGTNVPVAPYNSVMLGQDQANGMLTLMIKIDGRVRWKVGTFISGRYHMFVKCPAYITFGGRTTEIVVGENTVKYQLVQRCSVSV